MLERAALPAFLIDDEVRSTKRERMDFVIAFYGLSARLLFYRPHYLSPSDLSDRFRIPCESCQSSDSQTRIRLPCGHVLDPPCLMASGPPIRYLTQRKSSGKLAAKILQPVDILCPVCQEPTRIFDDSRRSLAVLAARRLLPDILDIGSPRYHYEDFTGVRYDILPSTALWRVGLSEVSVFAAHGGSTRIELELQGASSGREFAL